MRPRRVLAYCRVSSAEQADGTSLDAQREEIARHCRERGYPDPAWHVEAESGGAAGEERRVEQARLMASVGAGDLVIVAKQDRWSRWTLHLLRSVEQIQATGARFYSIAERFDPSTAEGKFATTIMAAVAEQEHARIRDRTVGARKRLRAMGHWIEGATPFGYRVDREARRLVIDPETAPIIREAYRLALDGVSLRDIGTTLEARHGYLPGLDHATLRIRLRSRHYRGETWTGEAWVASHEAIVDPATWQLVQDGLAARRKGGKRQTATARNAGFLARGLVTCGACGRTCTAYTPEPERGLRHLGYYLCPWRRAEEGRCPSPARARQDEVDAELTRVALAWLDALADRLAGPPPPVTPTPDRTAARARVLAQRERIVSAIADGTIARGEARARLDKLAAQLDALDAEAARSAVVAPPTREERRAALRDVRAIRAGWDGMTAAERRDVLRRLAASVVLASDRAPGERLAPWTLRVSWRDYSGG